MLAVHMEMTDGAECHQIFWAVIGGVAVPMMYLD
jgi:hypothetical protein